MKIITFSDLHIGNKYIDREVLDNLINDITSLVEPGSIIVFCGDLFHRRVELDTNEARMAIKLLKEIDSLNVPSFFIQGTFSHDYNYINTLLKIEFKNIKFFQTITEFDFSISQDEKLKMLFVPEEYIENQEEYYKDTIYNRNKKYDLIVLHGTFLDVLHFNKHMESESLRKAPKFDSKDFSRHTLVLSGHIHRHQIIGKKKNVIYVGSYSNMNFGDDKSNNIHKIDLDIKNRKFIMDTILNSSTHIFTDIEINDSNINELESTYLSKFKNKSDREHFRIRMKVDNPSYIDLLKELKREGYIKSLLIDTDIINNIEETDNSSSSNKIKYEGPIDIQIQTFIKENYDVDLDTEIINDLLK